MGCKELGSSRGQRQNRESDFLQSTALVLVLVLVLADTADTALGQLIDERNVVDIRSSIVEALGLRRIPDPAKANVSQAEYERANKEYLTRLRRSSEGDARQRRLFTMYATEEPTYEGARLSFPLSIENRENAFVESGTLRLLLDHDVTEPTLDNLEIRVYRKRASGARRRLLSRRIIREPETVRRRWLEFDVTDEVAAASINADAPFHLLVQLLHKNEPKSLSISSAALNVHAIYLDEEEEVEETKRTKRSPGSSAREKLMSLHRGRRTECRGEAKKCCRHHMVVAFKDLEGFDFIIQPKSFDAGYCKGRCPPRYNPAHHHALLQSLIWKEDRKKAPRPCCAPSKLAELEILYFDENDTTKLKVSNWKDMRVLECACS